MTYVHTDEALDPTLQVEVAVRERIALCLPEGVLDTTTVSTFKAAVGLCLGAPGLIFDLAGVRLIDGAGLNAVAGAVRHSHARRTAVGLVVPSASLRRVLLETGLNLVVSLSERFDIAFAEVQHALSAPEFATEPLLAPYPSQTAVETDTRVDEVLLHIVRRRNRRVG